MNLTCVACSVVAKGPQSFAVMPSHGGGDCSMPSRAMIGVDNSCPRTLDRSVTDASGIPGGLMVLEGGAVLREVLNMTGIRFSVKYPPLAKNDLRLFYQAVRSRSSGLGS
jgi:hypothetical protein